MPKLRNVTNDELQELANRCSNLAADLYDAAQTMEKGYVDLIESPVSLARTSNGLTRTCSEFTTMLLARAALDEQRKELEELHKASK